MQRKYLYIILGAISGLLFSIILMVCSGYDFSLYFLAAPYYLDANTVNTGKWISGLTFAYYTLLFSVIPYITILKKTIKFKVIVIVLMITIHTVLTLLGGRVVAYEMINAIKSWKK